MLRRDQTSANHNNHVSGIRVGFYQSSTHGCAPPGGTGSCSATSSSDPGRVLSFCCRWCVRKGVLGFPPPGSNFFLSLLAHDSLPLGIALCFPATSQVATAEGWGSIAFTASRSKAAVWICVFFGSSGCLCPPLAGPSHKLLPVGKLTRLAFVVSLFLVFSRTRLQDGHWRVPLPESMRRWQQIRAAFLLLVWPLLSPSTSAARLLVPFRSCGLCFPNCVCSFSLVSLPTPTANSHCRGRLLQCARLAPC